MVETGALDRLCELSGLALAAGAGKGVFLRVHSMQLLVLRGEQACVLPAIYLDAHGEEDPGLLRGRPLRLAPARLQPVADLWAQVRMFLLHPVLRATLCTHISVMVGHLARQQRLAPAYLQPVADLSAQVGPGPPAVCSMLKVLCAGRCVRHTVRLRPVAGLRAHVTACSSVHCTRCAQTRQAQPTLAWQCFSLQRVYVRIL